MFGFLGPNGAGKTTTIRMLVGLIKETEGTISIGGYSIKENFRKRCVKLGVSLKTELYTYLTGWENLKQFARMLGGISDERIIEIAHMVHLDERIHDKVKHTPRYETAPWHCASASWKSKLLILDEPTNGLDPAGIKSLGNLCISL